MTRERTIRGQQVTDAHAEALEAALADTVATKQDVEAVRRDLKDMEAVLRHAIALVRKDVESLGWKLTVQLGGMIAAGVGLLIILDKWIG